MKTLGMIYTDMSYVGTEGVQICAWPQLHCVRGCGLITNCINPTGTTSKCTRAMGLVQHLLQTTVTDVAQGQVYPMHSL